MIRWQTGLVALAIGTQPVFAQYLDQHRADRNPPTTTQSAAPVVLPKMAAQIAVTPFVLTGLQVSGVSVPAGLIAQATQPFVGKTIDAHAIATITQSLSDAYAKSEIALYTVVAPQQDFANGVLKLQVVEGYIAHVDLQGAGLQERDLDLIRIYAARLTEERPLRKSTLQRYVSLIRDIRGLKSDIQLLPGQEAGALLMVIKPVQRDFRYGISVNNNGNPLLGRTQVEADLTAYGLLREGEQTNLSLGTATSTGRFQFVSLADAQPLGTEGTMVQATGAYIHTKIKGFNLPGEAETVQFSVTHPLIRSYDENLSLSASVDGLDSSNALLGNLVASERVRAVRLAASYSLSSPADLFAASGTISQGLDILAAKVSLPGTAASDFQKFDFNLGYNRIFLSDWVARLKATVQLAGQRLPASELLNLGGTAYGRAFPVSTVMGDAGVAESMEIAWHPQSFFLSQLDGSELYGFMDRGETWYFERLTLNPGTVGITSGGLGARLAIFSDSTLGLEAARKLATPIGLRQGWAFNLSVRTMQ